MLDFYKLIPQINLVGEESSAEQDKAALVTQEAHALLRSLQSKEDEILVRLKSNEGLPLWPIALPLQSFASKYEVNESKQELSVIGVDGSQIMPSQHEILHCYLLNIGVVRIDYGTENEPILTSTPYFFHKKEQLYPLIDRRRLHIDELYVSLERNILELEILANQASIAKDAGVLPLCLVDGSLVPWSLERMPQTYQSQYLSRMSAILQVFQNGRLPLLGYISNSRSTEVINSMRILICPYEFANCKENCHDLNEDDFPCSTISPLTDRHLFSLFLPEFSRSAAFLSGAKVSKLLIAPLQTCFLYCNFGTATARIEFPRWLFEDKMTFESALTALTSQVRRGAGYPVVLAEAHHQAVIKSADREQFFKLLSKHYVSAGIGTGQRSAKAEKKHVSAI